MNSIAYSPSAAFLAAGSMGNGAHAWIGYDGETAYDLTYKNKREKTRASAPLAINQLAFSPDREFVATAANTDPGNPAVDVEALQVMGVWWPADHSTAALRFCQ